jgi:hypothetical protein
VPFVRIEVEIVVHLLVEECVQVAPTVVGEAATDGAARCATGLDKPKVANELVRH